MSAAYLASISDIQGPCSDECQHLDCAETRAMAAKMCRLCDNQMGFGVFFYSDPEGQDGDIVHASCLETFYAREMELADLKVMGS